jgi:hypothetical protein
MSPSKCESSEGGRIMMIGLISGVFMLGVLLGVVCVAMVTKYIVKTKGYLEFKWDGRWYSVYSRNHR